MRPELHDQRREHILTAARTLFLANGYARTKVEEVAKAARVANATVYTYFENKIGLFAAVIVRAFSPYEGLFDEIDRREDEPVVVLLTAWTRTYFGFMSDPEIRALYRLITAEQPVYPELADITYRDAHRILGGVLRRMLIRFDAAGALSIPDPAIATRLLQGMIEHASLTISMLQGDNVDPQHPLQPYSDEAVRVFMAGYAPNAAPFSDNP
jgi:TetR/AcrR family transcriptional regulator of autoinduction and epiphytic fitness